MTTWRDDPEVQKQIETLGGAYRLGKDVLRSMMATAVAADRRWLTSEIEKLPLLDPDPDPLRPGEKMAVVCYRRRVLALVKQENKP